MSSLITKFTKHLQFWLGSDITIRPNDVSQLLFKARDELVDVSEGVTIRIEGEPKDAVAVVQIIKEIFQASEQKVSTAMLPGGRIRREITLDGPNEPARGARPGNLDPSKVTGQAPKPASASPQPTGSEQLIEEALILLAQGILEFPADDEGRRIFSSFVYPATFEAGISKLTTYYFSKGIVINSSLKYWRLLSTPLKDWPHMPSQLQAPLPMIDHEGRATKLTERLAGQTPS